MEPNILELAISANAIAAGQRVELELMLGGCCDLKQLDPTRTRVIIDGGAPLDDIDVATGDAGHLSWTWRGTDLGRRVIGVEVFDTAGTRAYGEIPVYVFPGLRYRMLTTPDTIRPDDADIVLEVDYDDLPAGPATSKGGKPSPSAQYPALASLLGGAGLRFAFEAPRQGTLSDETPTSAVWHALDAEGGPVRIMAHLVDPSGRRLVTPGGGAVAAQRTLAVPPRPLTLRDTLRVALQRSSTPRTREDIFWPYVKARTLAIGSQRFADFVDRVLAPGAGQPTGMLTGRVAALSREARELRGCNYGVGAYELLKTAAQVYLLLECGGALDEDDLREADDELGAPGRRMSLADMRDRLGSYLPGGHLPYIQRVLDNAFRGQPEINRPLGYGVLYSRVHCPCLLELIWSYWHEEGMLVQTMNAITRRFQNVRAPGDRDPLAHLEIDPLRPLNNLLWGYIQDEWNRLSVKRRAYEYDHHYGVTVYGKAVPGLRPADSRSKFLEGFHNLLHLAYVFYKEDNDTTVIADGFPLLNALQEVHMLLAQGAHNQFGDLPWTARAEMLIQQWLLSRPEMRDFLQSQPMVPYKEAWMAPVDTMKTMQGWTDISVTHFRDLGVYGEQILLSVRWADWIGINNEDAAKNWARSWRPEIQGYIHAYRAVTGADLTNPDGVDHTPPAIHLRKRLALQRAR
jgi:hypothetical protein